MGDFEFLSDTDDSAVEDLISRTRDLCVLEQVAAINCSGFTHSELPDDLETRFRRLKSFPVAKSSPRPAPTMSVNRTRDYAAKSRCDTWLSPDEKSKASSQSAEDHFPTMASHSGGVALKSSCPSSDEERGVFSSVKEDMVPEISAKKKSGCNDSPSNELKSKRGKSLHEDDERETVRSVEQDFVKMGSKEKQVLSSTKRSRCGKKGLKPKPKHGSVSSPFLSSSPNSSHENVSSPSTSKKTKDLKPNSKSFDRSNPRMRANSPPQTAGCLWCSPKKTAKNKKKESKKHATDFDSDIDDFLSDLNAFPVEEQKKMLRKALEEQQKVRREAAKILKMSKQASAGMKLHGPRYDPSDDSS